MIKSIIYILLLIQISNLYELSYDLSIKKPFYIIDDKIYPIKINILQNYLFSLMSNTPYYGYINNVCINSYSCCSFNGSLIKKVYNQFCNYPFSTCSKLYTNTTSQCMDTLQ